MSLLPEYEDAVRKCWMEGVDCLMTARDSLLARIKREPPMPHVPEEASNPSTSGGYHGPLQAIEGRVAFEFDDFLNTTVDAWGGAVSECADSALPQVMGIMFSAMETATQEVGNVLDARGAPLSYDIVLDALDKIEMSFDENGQPKQLTLVLPPELAERFAALGPLSEAQQARFDSIIKRKREEHHARRRVRKLD